MNRVIRLIVVAILALLVTAPAVQAASPTTAFAGHWAAIDPGDGSNLDADISFNTKIRLTDDVATSACEGLSDQKFTSFSTGTIDGDELTSTMRWAKCGTVHVFFTGLVITWTLDDQDDANPSNDELANSFGETYTRVP